MANLIYDNISEQLEEKIRHMETGEKLFSERLMAQEYGVSRNMLRESLRVLSEKGLIEIRPGKGVYVANKQDEKFEQQMEAMLFDKENSLMDIVEVRETLEMAVCIKAVEKADEEDVLALEKIYERMEASRSNIAKFNKYDIKFHIQLAKSTKNNIFPMLIKTLYNLTDKKLFRITELYPSRVDSAQREHKGFIVAVQNRDYDMAKQVAKKHFSIKDIMDEKFMR